MECPYCGTENKSGNQKCDVCSGSKKTTSEPQISQITPLPLNTPAPEPQVDSPQKETSPAQNERFTWRSFVIILLAVFVFILILTLVMRVIEDSPTPNEHKVNKSTLTNEQNLNTNTPEPEKTPATKSSTAISNAMTHYNLGVKYVQDEKYVDALEQYKVLKSIDANLAEKLFNKIYDDSGK